MTPVAFLNLHKTVQYKFNPKKKFCYLIFKAITSTIIIKIMKAEYNKIKDCHDLGLLRQTLRFGQSSELEEESEFLGAMMTSSKMASLSELS